MPARSLRDRTVWLFVGLIPFAFAMLAAVARAQERPSASAVRIAEPPTLDGEVLNDPAWKDARPAVGFVQVAPFEGEPGSEQTEVRIAYTETTLYFGVICYDRRLRVSYSFSPRLFVQSLIQYNDRADIWSTNIRFGWLQRANTGLFVVFNNTDEFGVAGRSFAGRSFIVKFSRLIDLLD